jgi:hypothetical protein
MAIVAGFFVWRSTGQRREVSGTGPTIPPEVQEEFKRRGAGQTGAATSGPGASGMPAGVPTGPPRMSR